MPADPSQDATAPTVPASGVLTVEDGQIEWSAWPGRDADESDALVLLHEALGSVGLWRTFPAALAQATGRRVVAYSRHGHGWSAGMTQPRAGDYLHREAREALPQVLDGLGIARPVLIGHSDGASIALIAAGEATVDAAGLVVMAPHVVVEEVALEGIRRARVAYDESGLKERMARHHDDANRLFFAWHDTWLSPEFRTWDITGVLPSISCPVLAIQGVDDRYGTMLQLDEIEAGVRGGFRRAELTDCDHSPHLEQPEATLQAISSFVGRLRRGSARRRGQPSVSSPSGTSTSGAPAT